MGARCLTLCGMGEMVGARISCRMWCKSYGTLPSPQLLEVRDNPLAEGRRCEVFFVSLMGGKFSRAHFILLRKLPFTSV